MGGGSAHTSGADRSVDLLTACAAAAVWVMLFVISMLSFVGVLLIGYM